MIRLLVATLLLISSATIGQESKSSKVGVKLLLDYNTVSVEEGYKLTPSNLKFSLNIKTRKGNSFEFGIDKLFFSKTQQNYDNNYLFTLEEYPIDVKEFQMDFRIDYAINLNPKMKKTNYYIGLANQIVINTISKGGYDNVRYPSNQQSLKSFSMLQSKIAHQFANNFQFDFSLNISFLESNFHSSKLFNPSVRMEAQRQSTLTFENHADYLSVRTGLSYFF